MSFCGIRCNKTSAENDLRKATKNRLAKELIKVYKNNGATATRKSPYKNRTFQVARQEFIIFQTRRKRR